MYKVITECIFSFIREGSLRFLKRSSEYWHHCSLWLLLVVTPVVYIIIWIYIHISVFICKIVIRILIFNLHGKMIHLVTDQECWGTSQYTYIIREKRCAKYLTLTLLISSSNCSIYYTTVYSKRTQPSKWLMKSKKWVFIIKIRPKWISTNLCKEKSWCQLSSRYLKLFNKIWLYQEGYDSKKVLQSFN